MKKYNCTVYLSNRSFIEYAANSYWNAWHFVEYIELVNRKHQPDVVISKISILEDKS